MPWDGIEYDPNAPRLPYALVNLPVPAHGRMSDEEIANLVLREYRRRSRKDLDLDMGKGNPELLEYEGELNILGYDPLRMIRMDLETITPRGDDYADVLLALA